MGIRTTEEPAFRVINSEGDFELREYDSLVVAQTLVETAYDDAGKVGFRRLFGYISGENQGNTDISMTAPVITSEASAQGEKIAMTAPVTREPSAEGWRMAFVLPASMTLDNAPLPLNPDVKLVEIPAKQVAVIRYSGVSSESRFRENTEALREWMALRQLEVASIPRIAGYDPPWTLPPMRRNEVMIDVKNQ